MDDSGGAFPELHNDQYSGLTKREYFAALALQGMLANPGIGRPRGVNDAESLAEDAVIYADALLETLSKR